MKRFAFYFHGGCGNRGCEAIVRTSSDIVRSAFKDAYINLYSSNPDEDTALLTGTVDEITDMEPSHSGCSFDGFADKIKMKFYSLNGSKKADEYYFSKQYKSMLKFNEDVFLSIGGDNYCYGENTSFSSFNIILKELKKKSVLWGCSVDESSFSDYLKLDFSRYDAIFVRETLSRKLFNDNGYKDNVFLYPDPAFTLPVEKLPLPDKFIDGNTVGINISPLILNLENQGNKGIGIEAAKRLCEYIIENTDMNIAFIPHVYWDSNYDLTPLKKLNEMFSESGRTVLLESILTAPQIKGYISRCRFFVGARTHATIAAYSTMVPTLVLGYSTKSKGIATDLFGTDDGYVLPIQELSDADSLTLAFKQIVKKESPIKERLNSVVPGFIKRSHSAGEKLWEIIN